MKTRSILIAGFLLFSLFVFCIVFTEQLVWCNPISPRLLNVEIEGAHIVSEGAYFRFWIFNNNSFSINVTVNGGDALSIPPHSGIDYDVIAPQIFMPYEKVTYKLFLSSYDAILPADYTVLVLDSGFVQIFNLIVPTLIVIAVVIIATVAIVILRRRRALRKT